MVTCLQIGHFALFPRWGHCGEVWQSNAIPEKLQKAPEWALTHILPAFHISPASPFPCPRWANARLTPKQVGDTVILPNKATLNFGARCALKKI